MSEEKIWAAKQLVVEGRDAQRFASEVLRHLGLSEIQVLNYGGVSELRPFLKALMKAPENNRIRSVGVVRDAEEEHEGAFRSACSALVQAGLRAPEVSGQVEPGEPQVGVFIFPDGSGPGALETLCLKSLEGNLAEPCVREYLRCRDALGEAVPLSLARRHKRELYCLLCYRHPGLKLGEAAAANAFPFDSAVFAPFKEFLRQL